ncbi:MAG: sensor histidine kinase [Armatimonadota bacterium]|nr:sensor histidine kinase [Armatimonadota bacterium]
MQVRQDGNMVSNRLERLFLYHLWACVPFAVAWMIWPGIVGAASAPDEVLRMRIVTLVAGVCLLVRSWRTFRPIRRDGSMRESIIWPIIDVLLISAALFVRAGADNSWIVLLYLLPITQASATLNLRWALLVGGLAVASYLLVFALSGNEMHSYFYGAFRLFFLLLMASLVTSLGREVARAREELALANYKNQLAAEMHDGIQQYLSGTWTRLELAHKMIPHDPVQAARIAVDQRYALRQAADELRTLVRRLRSPLLTEEGLVETLRHQVTLFAERTDVGAELRVTGAPIQLDPALEHTLLRIVQEALTNVAKHARATQVTVGLEFEPQEIRCTIRDNGIGFDPAQLPAESDGLSGLGMETMRQRATAVGGTCAVQSQAGEGTSVTVILPLRRL